MTPSASMAKQPRSSAQRSRDAPGSRRGGCFGVKEVPTKDAGPATGWAVERPGRGASQVPSDGVGGGQSLRCAIAARMPAT
jgi:hypothetical protein